MSGLGSDFLADIKLEAPMEQDVQQQPVANTAPAVETQSTQEQTPTPSPETPTEQPAPEAQAPEGTPPTGNPDTPALEQQTNPFFQDVGADLFDQQPATAVETAAPVAPATPDYSQFFQNAAQRLGVERIENEQQLYQQIDQLNRYKGALDKVGITPELAEMVDQGYLGKEEILSGQFAADPYQGNDDDAVFDMLQEADPNRTDAQIRELMEDMTPGQKAGYAANYRATYNIKRDQAKAAVRQFAAQRQAQAQAQQAQIQQSRQVLQENVGRVLREMKEIPGTATVPSVEQKQLLERVLTEPQALQRLLFGNDLRNPDYNRAITAVASVAFRGTIMRDLADNSKNQGMKQMMDSMSNIQVPGSQSKPVSAAPAKSGTQELIDFIDGELTQKMFTKQ